MCSPRRCVCVGAWKMPKNSTLIFTVAVVHPAWPRNISAYDTCREWRGCPQQGKITPRFSRVTGGFRINFRLTTHAHRILPRSGPQWLLLVLDLACTLIGLCSGFPLSSVRSRPPPYCPLKMYPTSFSDQSFWPKACIRRFFFDQSERFYSNCTAAREGGVAVCCLRM